MILDSIFATGKNKKKKVFLYNLKLQAFVKLQFFVQKESFKGDLKFEIVLLIILEFGKIGHAAGMFKHPLHCSIVNNVIGDPTLLAN